MDLGGPYVRALFGEHAVHVPAWFYVQHQGGDARGEFVSFVGASRVDPGQPHPLRFGSGRSHQLVIGDIVARPHVVHGTDELEGAGLAGLVTGGGHDIAMAGDLVIATRPVGRVGSTW
jgi:hypothetical protein